MIINLAKIRFGGNTGGGAPAKPEDFFEKSYTANGAYDITPEAGHVFSGGHVEVDVHPTESLSLTITESGSYTSNNEFNGYSINVDVEGPKPEETLTQTITENGSHVFNPSEGHVFNSASITVEVPQGITPTGTININDNGTYDVTDKATAVVAVGGKDYRYRTGTPDVVGLTAIGWDADSIGYYGANAPHYAWENDNYKVSQENIDLYSLDDPQPSLYKNNPNVTFVPNKNMSKYFGRGGAFDEKKYIKSIPWYDTSNVTDMENMFRFCSSLQSIPPLDTSNVTRMPRMFQRCTSLQSIPPLDTSNVTDMGALLADCKSLTSIPPLDTSKVTSMGSMFSGCSKLTSIPQLDTSKVTSMSRMFYDCKALQTIPQLDASSATDTNYMFYRCSSLTSIPQMDTSSVTNMNNMFYGCENLTFIPQLDTSKVTDMSSMFDGCSKLTSIPPLDTSSATNVNAMFSECSKITSIPPLDTSKATDMSDIFYGCSMLQRVDGIDFSSLTSYPSRTFGYGSRSLLHCIVNGSINFSWDNSYGFYGTPNLDYESIKSILEAMNRTTNTNAKTMEFNQVVADQNGELTGLVTSCATKGWTVTGLTIKEQSMINSITPNIEHITKSNFTRDSSNKLSLTINANENWTAGGRPQKHGGSSLGIDFDYYDATTNEKLREGFHSNGSTFTPTSGGIGETIIEADVPSGYSYQPDPQPGEYALVGITFKTASSPYEYVDYYFKIYPDGE